MKCSGEKSERGAQGMKNRKKYGWRLSVWICLAAAVLTGCGGASGEKIEEVQTVYGELVDRHNEVIEAYANVEDESLNKKLDEMAEQINAIGQQDVKRMEDEEVEGIIAELRANIVIYDDILTSIDKLKAQEATVYGVPFTLKNDTGIALAQVYLYNKANEERGENLIKGMETLDGYGTFNMLNLYMTEDEMLWHLEAVDNEGDTIVSEDIDFSERKEEGVTARIVYDFDSKAGHLEFES